MFTGSNHKQLSGEKFGSFCIVNHDGLTNDAAVVIARTLVNGILRKQIRNLWVHFRVDARGSL